VVSGEGGAKRDGVAHWMRAASCCAGRLTLTVADAWEAGPRSAAELKKAATHYDRAAALCPAPAGKSELAGIAAWSLVPHRGRNHVTCDMSRLHSAPALKGARLKHQMRAIVLTGQTTPSEALFEALCSSVC
jgi:hypothetical protein